MLRCVHTLGRIKKNEPSQQWNGSCISEINKFDCLPFVWLRKTTLISRYNELLSHHNQLQSHCHSRSQRMLEPSQQKG